MTPKARCEESLREKTIRHLCWRWFASMAISIQGLSLREDQETEGRVCGRGNRTVCCASGITIASESCIRRTKYFPLDTIPLRCGIFICVCGKTEPRARPLIRATCIWSITKFLFSSKGWPGFCFRWSAKCHDIEHWNIHIYIYIYTVADILRIFLAACTMEMRLI